MEPLNEDEKILLQKHYGNEKFHNAIVGQILQVRDGKYPPDWGTQVIGGALFKSTAKDSEDAKVQIVNVNLGLSYKDLQQLLKEGKAKHWVNAEYSPAPYPKPYDLYVMCEGMKKIVKVSSVEEGKEYLFQLVQAKLYCVKK